MMTFARFSKYFFFSPILAVALRGGGDDTPNRDQKLLHRKLMVAPQGSEVIENSYIIVLKDTVTNVDTKMTEMLDMTHACISNLNAKSSEIDTAAGISFQNGIKGISMSHVPSDALQILLEDNDVDWIEPDQVVKANDMQSNAPWNLDLLDDSSAERKNQASSKIRQYAYSNIGTGVNVYVLDTGIRPTHSEFTNGRAKCGFDVFGANCEDVFGHGSHVAGIVGGSTYGVAKGATLIAVKILGDSGSGSLSDVIRGVDYVVQQRQANKKQSMVMNMSLGAGVSAAINDAVKKAVDAGIVVVVAAGNSSGDACQASPASAASAITVGSIAPNDELSYFSNYGKCVDLFAPGSDIVSVGSSADGATATYSGTSQASPHVAGVAALYMELNPTFTPTDVVNAIKSASYKGSIVEKTSPNDILSTENFAKKVPPSPGVPAPVPAPRPRPVRRPRRNRPTYVRPSPTPRLPAPAPTGAPPNLPGGPCSGFYLPCTQNKKCCSGKCGVDGRCTLL